MAQLGGGNISLQASNGQYVCAENGGGRELVASRGAVGPWETFQRTPVVRYQASTQVAIEAAVGGGVTANFDFGASDKYIFNGNLLGVSAAVGVGTAEFHVAPEDLIGLGAVNVQVITTIGYFTFGWQRQNGQPVGEVQCDGLTLPGGGAGQGVFVHA